jgi:hypothetical protein
MIDRMWKCTDIVWRPEWFAYRLLLKTIDEPVLEMDMTMDEDDLKDMVALAQKTYGPPVSK